MMVVRGCLEFVGKFSCLRSAQASIFTPRCPWEKMLGDYLHFLKCIKINPSQAKTELLNKNDSRNLIEMVAINQNFYCLFVNEVFCPVYACVLGGLKYEIS